MIKFVEFFKKWLLQRRDLSSGRGGGTGGLPEVEWRLDESANVILIKNKYIYI